MSKEQKPDKIRVWLSPDAPSSSRVRWTRHSWSNGRIIGASSEGYARKQSAVANIYRTQKAPYEIIMDDSLYHNGLSK